MKNLLFLLIISCVSFSQDFEIPRFIDFSGIEASWKYEEEERNRVLNEEGEDYYYVGDVFNPVNTRAVIGWGGNSILAFVENVSVEDEYSVSLEFIGCSLNPKTFK